MAWHVLLVANRGTDRPRSDIGRPSNGSRLNRRPGVTRGLADAFDSSGSYLSIPTMVSRTHRVLLVIALAELLAMSLWFSATAAAPELAAEWGLTDGETAWLTIAVQLGFVAGALLSSALTLADVVRPRYLFAASAVAGTAFTAVIAGFVTSAVPAIALRFLTGVALAGVYPTGMKILAGWFEGVAASQSAC